MISKIRSREFHDEEVYTIGRFRIPFVVLRDRLKRFDTEKHVSLSSQEIVVIFSSLEQTDFWSEPELDLLRKLIKECADGLTANHGSAPAGDPMLANAGRNDFEERIDHRVSCFLERTFDYRMFLRFLSISPEKNILITSEFEGAISSRRAHKVLGAHASMRNTDILPSEEFRLSHHHTVDQWVASLIE